MKKKLTIVVLLSLLISICGISFADYGTTWNCPNCGRTSNNDNYCPNCAYPRAGEGWTCSNCGRTGNTGNFCPSCRAKKPEQEIWALAIDRLSINAGPGTSRYFREIGTYRVKGQFCRVFAKSWDTDNGIWWIQCAIPGSNNIIGWTGLKRFDQSTFNLNDLPEVIYDRKTRTFR